MSSSLDFKKPAVVGTLLFLAAFLFRFVGIRWGLPNQMHAFSYHPDEPIILGYAQSLNPLGGNFLPHFYNYPTLYLTILRLFSGAAPQNSADYASYMAGAHLVGRMISAVAGASIVLCVYRCLHRITNPLGAICGSVAALVAPALVVHSRFQTVDMLAACFFAWSVERALALALEGKDWDEKRILKTALAAGALAGLSAGTKYTGILGLGSLVVALISLRPKNAAICLFGAIGTAIVVFVVTTPGIILDQKKFIADFLFEAKYVKEGHGDTFALTAPGALFHLGNLSTGLSPLLALVGLVAAGYAAFRKHNWAWVMLGSWLPYYLILCNGQDKFMRYTLPLFFGLAFFIGYAAGTGHRKQNIWGYLVILFVFLGLGGVDRGGLTSSATYTMLMNGEDARDRAALWLRENGKGKAVGIVSDPWTYTPPLYFTTGSPRDPDWNRFAVPMLAATDPRVVRYTPENPQERFDFDTRLLDQGPDFVVLSNIEEEPYIRWVNAKPKDGKYKLFADRYLAFMEALAKQYEPANRFGETEPGLVHDMQYVRPEIRVWQKKR